MSKCSTLCWWKKIPDFREERGKEWINHGNVSDQKTGGGNEKKASEDLDGMNLVIFQLSLGQESGRWGES